MELISRVKSIKFILLLSPPFAQSKFFWPLQSGGKNWWEKQWLQLCLFTKKNQHHFKKLEIIRSIISVNTTPTTVHSLFLRVKTFIFFSFSLSSMTFFFPPLPDTPLDGVCFSHSYSHKGSDPLSPVWDPRNFLGMAWFRLHTGFAVATTAPWDFPSFTQLD